MLSKRDPEAAEVQTPDWSRHVQIFRRKLASSLKASPYHLGLPSAGRSAPHAAAPCVTVGWTTMPDLSR